MSEELFDRVETFAIQHSRSSEPGVAQHSRDVLAVLRIARAGEKLSQHFQDGGTPVMDEGWATDVNELVGSVFATKIA